MTSDRYEIDDKIYINNTLTDQDIPSMIKYLNNPTIYAHTLNIPHPYTREDGEKFIKMIQSELDATHFFAVRLNENNELIGACGLHGSVKNKRSVEIGYWLGEPYWRRGLMSKVVKKVIEIAKDQCKDLVRIEAEIFTWNDASRRLVEKCGFVYEGLLRKRVYKNGQDIDVCLYAFIIE